MVVNWRSIPIPPHARPTPSATRPIIFLFVLAGIGGDARCAKTCARGDLAETLTGMGAKKPRKGHLQPDEGSLGSLRLPRLWKVRVPKELSDDVERMLGWFEHEGRHHPFLRGHTESEWQDKTCEIVRAAERGDFDAFLALCQRDPRYIVSELAGWYILRWRLQELAAKLPYPDLGEHPLTRDAQLQRLRLRTAGRAAGKVRHKLARAIGRLTGHGPVSPIRGDVVLLFRRTVAALRPLRTRLQYGEPLDKVAASTLVPRRLLEQLRVRGRERYATWAKECIAEWYGVGEERVEEWLKEGRRAYRQSGADGAVGPALGIPDRLNE